MIEPCKARCRNMDMSGTTPEPPASNKSGAAIGDFPNEMADRPAKLDCVSNHSHVMEEGRDLAVIKPLDGELDDAPGIGRRCDGVAALGAITVRRREPHIHMLPRAEGEGVRRREEEAFDA